MSENGKPQPNDDLSGAPDHEAGEPVDRRAALRRVVTAAGLTAGALSLPGLVGTAQAAPGDLLKAGGSVSAGSVQTGLRADSTIAALKVENAHIRSAVAGQVDVVAPQLRLAAPVPSTQRPQVPDLERLKPGDVAVAGGAVFVGADLGDAEAMAVQVHTAAFANYFEPVPFSEGAVFDTAALTPEVRATFAAGTFDGQGRLAASTRLPVSLRGWVDTTHLPGTAAVSVSLTATVASASGVVSAHTGADSPGGVAVAQLTVLPGAVLAGGQPLALPVTAGAILPLDTSDTLWLSASVATHVSVQLVGLLIADPSAVVEKPDVAAKSTGSARRSALQRQAVREMTVSATPPK